MQMGCCIKGGGHPHKQAECEGRGRECQRKGDTGSVKSQL